MYSKVSKTDPEWMKDDITCDLLVGAWVRVGLHPGDTIVRHLLRQVGVQLLLGDVVPLLE